MEEVYLLLGSNEGDRDGNIAAALKLIESRAGALVKLSSMYETEPWGIKEQKSFLNKAVIINTWLSPEKLLIALKEIEHETGRTETVKWGPRVIDIDILFYDDFIVDTPNLKIPHPFIAERRFTLEALNEIAPALVHPALNKTIAVLLSECPDTLGVKQVVG